MTADPAVHHQAPGRVRTVTGEPGSPPAMIENPDAVHQIRLVNDGSYGTGSLIVTCTCLARRTGPGAGRGCPRAGIIEARTGTFPASEAQAAWHSWHTERGIEL